MRLIDADAMKERFCDGVGAKPFDWAYDIHDLAGILSEMPTIDAVPVVHGLWVYGEDDYDDSTYYCSACRGPWTLIAGTPKENNMRYCPFCGAKMDGGTE